MSHKQQPMPPTTMPDGIRITIQGITIPERATEFGQVLGAYMRSIGTVIDISRLAGVTASDDYSSALAEVERGFGTVNPLVRSNNVDMVGMAMAAPVVRDGVVKSHLVFDIGGVLPLYMLAPDDLEHRQALYMVAHECAHIEDLKMKDEAFPGTLLQQREATWMEMNLGPVGHGLWDEYYACRRSALFHPEHTALLANVMVSCLDNAQGEADQAIRAYRLHHDLTRVWHETLGPGTRTMKAASYLYGHLDGLGADWDAIPQIRNRLEEHPLLPVLDDMSQELNRLWDVRGRWAGYDDFAELIGIARDAWEVSGVDAQERPDGSAYLDVPCRPWNS